MSDFEASGGIRPHFKQKRFNPVRKAVRGYLTVICILFLAVFALCTNNFILYSSYSSFKSEFEASISRINAVGGERAGLISEKDTLATENAGLKKEMENIKEINRQLLAQNEETQKQMQEIKRTNEEVVKKNKELVEDNIALQNSLKKAAAVGIKPQSYTSFDGISSRGELIRGRYLGKFQGTAYTPSSDECGNNKGITNSGKPIIPGISVAVDNRHWPFGTVFYIKGLGYAVAMDTGSAIKGKQRFDFAVFDKGFAKSLGAKKWDVYLVKLGKGYVEEVKF